MIHDYVKDLSGLRHKTAKCGNIQSLPQKFQISKILNFVLKRIFIGIFFIYNLRGRGMKPCIVVWSILSVRDVET